MTYRFSQALPRLNIFLVVVSMPVWLATFAQSACAEMPDPNQYTGMDFDTLRNALKSNVWPASATDRDKADFVRQIVHTHVEASNGAWGTTKYIASGMGQTAGITNGDYFNKANQTDSLSNQPLDSITLAQKTWEAGMGVCDPQATLMQVLLTDSGVASTILRRDGTNGHAFPVVGLDKGADPDNPWTWGSNAFVPDSWQGETISGPQNIWDNGEIFNGGTYHVYDGRVKLPPTRELIDDLAAHPNMFDNSPGALLALVERIDAYPPEIRDQLLAKLPQPLDYAIPDPGSTPNPTGGSVPPGQSDDVKKLLSFAQDPNSNLDPAAAPPVIDANTAPVTANTISAGTPETAPPDDGGAETAETLGAILGSGMEAGSPAPGYGYPAPTGGRPNWRPCR
ncbi:MAG TPA: hypothetical protein VIY49_15700 [Bryobacteraceae bacterium]